MGRKLRSARNGFEIREECKAHLNILMCFLSLRFGCCICPAGYSGVWGSPCVPCSLGYYKDSVGYGSCIRCPVNMSLSGGLATPKLCSDNFYASKEEEEISFTRIKLDPNQRNSADASNMRAPGIPENSISTALELRNDQNPTNLNCGYGIMCCPGLYFQEPFAMMVTGSWSVVRLNVQTYTVSPIEYRSWLPTVTKFSPDGQYLIGIGNFGGSKGGTVYRINYPSLDMQIIAGRGMAESNEGDSADGYGTLAEFDGPSDVAFSSDGNFVLIADQAGYTGTPRCRIRKLEISTYFISTIAGSRCGDQDGIGTTAEFPYFLESISISPDQSFALASGSSLIKKIDLETFEVTTIARGFHGYVNDVQISPNGKFAVFFMLYYYSVGLISFPDNTVTTLAGSDGCGSVDGIGPTAQFEYIDSLTLSPEGTYALILTRPFCGNSGQVHSLRRIDIETGNVTTIMIDSSYIYGVVLSGCSLCKEGGFSGIIGAMSCSLCESGTYWTGAGPKSPGYQ
jgi:DNA-binding beta-propeller fold protein YncE